MQSLEIIFFVLTALLLLSLVKGQKFGWLKSTPLLLITGAVLCLGLLIEGYRWQIIPAYIAFSILLFAAIKAAQNKNNTGKINVWVKLFGATVLALLLGFSVLLAQQLPIFTLPEPAGPYAVGTFDYTTIDNTRQERFAPELHRELYIKVWYPVDKSRAAAFPVGSLWQELYKKDLDMIGFFSAHLKHIYTHSHIKAPIATGEKFPVLLFNHGLFLLAEQNTVLMEHLVSHGYVVFSIAHPYESGKVNLKHAGSIVANGQLPSDAGLTEEMKNNGEQTFYNISDKGNADYLKAVNELIIDFSTATNEQNKRLVVKNALARERIHQIEPPLTAGSLYNLLTFLNYNNRSIDSWVQDIQFVANNIIHFEAPIEGFLKSLNTENFGVFGMSRGGAAAAEFCRIDSRCSAGGNMDGFQYGKHWDTTINVPFLMMYSVENSGMNDFTYLPAGENFLDYTIEGTMHADFTDLVSIMPLIHYLDMGDKINAQRIYKIINTIQLRFFDRYLKGEKSSKGVSTEIPELLIRKH